MEVEKRNAFDGQIEGESGGTTPQASDYTSESRGCNTLMTVVRISEGHQPVNKRFDLTPEGEITKTASGVLYTGTAYVVDCPDAAAMAQLLQRITEQPDTVLIAGAPRQLQAGDVFEFTTERTFREMFGIAPGVVIDRPQITDDGKTIYAPRLKTAWQPCVWTLIDCDNPPGIPAAQRALDIEGRLRWMSKILPGIDSCERIELASSSARVMPMRFDGTLQDPARSHAWIRIDEPTKLDEMRRYTQIVGEAQELHFESPHANGYASSRFCIDTAVWVQNRIAFTAKPALSRGLDAVGYTVAPAAVCIVNAGQGRFDTSCVRSPSVDELRAVSAQRGRDTRIGESGAESIDCSDMASTLRIDVSGEWLTVDDLRARYAGTPAKLRCQTPFRESCSEAGLLRLNEDGFACLHDVGTGTNHIFKPALPVADTAAFAGVPVPVDEQERRRQQKEASRRIGAGEVELPLAIELSVESALETLVLVGGHSVVPINSPRSVMLLDNFKKHSAASRVRVPRPDKPPLERAVMDVWLEHRTRLTVEAVTFRAGAPLFTRDPSGKTAVNSWVPFDRTPADVSVAQPFFDHLRWLFGERAEAFLDWLAHIEQRPGELPHHGWLHISHQTGTGRNLVESILARLWRGQVAANLELKNIIDKGFNDALSGRVLATINEIRIGGAGARWNEGEQLKSMVTAEFRTINPKHLRPFEEFNSCRWLVFSNHIDALPLHDNDRRWNVVISGNDPQPAIYYAALYNSVDDPAFINAIGVALSQRDISSFNPGSHAMKNDARERVIRTTMSDLDLNARALIENWPSDVIANSDLVRCMEPLGRVSETTGSMRSALSRFGGLRAKPFKSDGARIRGWILRDPERWEQAEGFELAAEMRRGREAVGDLCAWVREHIDGSVQCFEGMLR